MLAYTTILERARAHLKPASLYAAFGICALALELTIFFVLVEKAQTAVLLANTVAMVCGMLVSFGLNAMVNFKISDKLVKRFASYAGVVGLGYLLSSGLLSLFIFLHAAPFTAKLLTLPFVFVFQYGLNRRFAFK